MKRRLAHLALAPIAVLTLIGIASPAYAQFSYSNNTTKVSRSTLQKTCGGHYYSNSQAYGCTTEGSDGSSDTTECTKKGCTHFHSDAERIQVSDPSRGGVPVGGVLIR